ncbi:MAG: serine/threonine protein kinase [Deltaproteobacteria bacterium]|nr:serine/threonine protein kinase [Deltaproteobacteria bacterium]
MADPAGYFDVEALLGDTAESADVTGTFDPPELDPTLVRPRPEALIGSSVHGFKLEEIIGAGSFALVFRARHEFLGRRAAVKLVRPGLSEVAKKRLLREAALLARVEHENLVRVLDCGLSDAGDPFMVLDFLEGRTLRQVISDEAPFSIERTARLGLRIARGLFAAHAQGIVHRDLKPANIILVDAGDEVPKIFDFGLGAARGRPGTKLTSAGEILGTPAYMAPEQILEATAAGPPADVYALGGVLYQMKKGELVFGGPSPAAVMDQHLREPCPDLGADGALGRLIMRMLEKRPEDRPAAAEILDQLERIVQGDDDLPTRFSGSSEVTEGGSEAQVTEPGVGEQTPREVPEIFMEVTRTPESAREVTRTLLSRADAPTAIDTPRARPTWPKALPLLFALGAIGAAAGFFIRPPPSASSPKSDESVVRPLVAVPASRPAARVATTAAPAHDPPAPSVPPAQPAKARPRPDAGFQAPASLEPKIDDLERDLAVVLDALKATSLPLEQSSALETRYLALRRRVSDARRAGQAELAGLQAEIRALGRDAAP